MYFGHRAAQAPHPDRRVVAVSAANQPLSLGTLMIAQLLREHGYYIDYPTYANEHDLLRFIHYTHPVGVLVSCGDENAAATGYSLLGAIAGQFPDQVIVASGTGFVTDPEKALAAGATYVPPTLSEAKREILTRFKVVLENSPIHTGDEA